jgi:hypothetical protein
MMNSMDFSNPEFFIETVDESDQTRLSDWNAEKSMGSLQMVKVLLDKLATPNHVFEFKYKS